MELSLSSPFLTCHEPQAVGASLFHSSMYRLTYTLSPCRPFTSSRTQNGVQELSTAYPRQFWRLYITDSTKWLECMRRLGPSTFCSSLPLVECRRLLMPCLHCAGPSSQTTSPQGETGQKGMTFTTGWLPIPQVTDDTWTSLWGRRYAGDGS